MRERNLSLELVKFIAVVFVANHWMSSLYVKWNFLATGGAIGDVLFFFASGYTLFLGRFGRFDNWYKRRIKRIYPSIIAYACILSCLGVCQISMNQIVKGGGAWFIKCIMIYYVVLYFVRLYAEKKPFLSFPFSIAVVFVWYCFEDSTTLFMYGATYFKWGHYFLFMLLGAYLGNDTIKVESKPLLDASFLLVSIITYYGILILATRNETMAHLQLFSLVPLMGVVMYVYKLCSMSKIDKIMRSKIGSCLQFVSGLCLEIYIVQAIVIRFMEGRLSSIFPLNLPLTFLLIVVSAFFVRCFGRIISQLFEKDDFDWKAVFRLLN